MGETCAFVADLHLLPGDHSEQATRLCLWLNRVWERADRLVILGDLFHGWFERRGRVWGEYGEVLAIFSDVAKRGLRIDLVSGNHDFVHGWTESNPEISFYAERVQAWRSVLEQAGVFPCGFEMILEKGSMRILCTHGDEFCTADWRYRYLKRFLTSKTGRWLARYTPYWVGFPIFSHLQNKKKRMTKHVIPPFRSMQEADVHIAMRAADCEWVLCGHSHQRKTVVWEDGRWDVLGAWADGQRWYTVEWDDPSLLLREMEH